MPKPKTYFVCQTCGYQAAKWLGRCPACGEWNSLVEEVAALPETPLPVTPHSTPQPINQLELAPESRFSTNIAELDRVLGGGLVLGSVILLGGDPGIGKSTLLLQAAARTSSDKHKVLYASGEESASQIKLRAQRLGISAPNLYVVAETSSEAILQQIAKFEPQVLILDSIQTAQTAALQSLPGSLGQVRQVAAQIIQVCKDKNICGFLVGHVTKEGSIAGPRTLEHMVDTVLYLEGERYHSYRILRAAKNRFGATSKIGVFEMKEQGLEEVANPSELFLAERSPNAVGSVVVATLEGTRPILVELQALVSTSGAIPRRNANGLELNRIFLLLAVMEKRLGIHVNNLDVFLNVAGGLQIAEPAVDLGVLCAVVSNVYNRSLDTGLVVMGEVGLGGEVRRVSQAEIRLREAAKLGFTRALLPHGNLTKLPPNIPIEVKGIKLVREIMEEIG